ncbi:MAG TPA: hypothetical protein VGN09_09890 [Vicinamibacteria bacterium]
MSARRAGSMMFHKRIAGSFESLGSNHVAGNSVDTTGTITVVAPH